MGNVSWLEFRVVAVEGFRFVAEVEGLKGKGVGAIAPTPRFLSLRLRKWRAIGFEVGVRSVKSAS
jgi:hypothetical protein